MIIIFKTIQNSQFQIILQAFLSTLALVLESLLIFIIFLMFSGIFGFQILSKVLKNKCILSSFGLEQSENSEDFCGNIKCSSDKICSKVLKNPDEDLSSFDNIFSSLLQVLRIITFDDWTRLMNQIQKTWTNFSFIYFLFVAIIGNFFLIQFIFAVMKIKFSDNLYKLKVGKKKHLSIYKESDKVYNFKEIKSIENIILNKKKKLGDILNSEKRNKEKSFLITDFIFWLLKFLKEKISIFFKINKKKNFCSKKSNLKELINKKRKLKENFKKFSYALMNISSYFSKLMALDSDKNLNSNLIICKKPLSLRIKTEIIYESLSISDILPTKLENYYENHYRKILLERKNIRLNFFYNYNSIKKEIIIEDKNNDKNTKIGQKKGKISRRDRKKTNFTLINKRKKFMNFQQNSLYQLKRKHSKILLGKNFKTFNSTALKKNSKIKRISFHLNKENLIKSFNENLNLQESSYAFQDNNIIYVNKIV